jgi:hypothetical protein
MEGQKTTLKRAEEAVFPFVFPDTYAPSMAEDNGVHNPAWNQREQPRNHQRAGEY